MELRDVTPDGIPVTEESVTEPDPVKEGPVVALAASLAMEVPTESPPDELPVCPDGLPGYPGGLPAVLFAIPVQLEDADEESASEPTEESVDAPAEAAVEGVVVVIVLILEDQADDPVKKPAGALEEGSREDKAEEPSEAPEDGVEREVKEEPADKLEAPVLDNDAVWLSPAEALGKVEDPPMTTVLTDTWVLTEVTVTMLLLHAVSVARESGRLFVWPAAALVSVETAAVEASAED
ncbi:MAG: hypothetical protein Q9157_002266 [Trypethelium eluteriae]